MQYRKLPRGTEEISVLGIGTSSIQASSEKEIEKIITVAMENGINYLIWLHRKQSLLLPMGEL